MKTSFSTYFIAAILGIALIALPGTSNAQGTMNALTYTPFTGGYSPNIIVFNYTGAVGWSFTPNSDLLVTAISSIAPQVSFWSGTDQVIASYDFTGSPTDFQSVPSLLLSAGQVYSMTTQCSNTTFVIYAMGSAAPFTTSSYISQFESFVGLPSSQSGVDASSLYGGPNFQFQVVPEPRGLDYLLPVFCIWCLFRSKLVTDTQTPPNRVAGRIGLPAPTPPDMRVRIRRFRSD